MRHALFSMLPTMLVLVRLSVSLLLLPPPSPGRCFPLSTLRVVSLSDAESGSLPPAVIETLYRLSCPAAYVLATEVGDRTMYGASCAKRAT